MLHESNRTRLTCHLLVGIYTYMNIRGGAGRTGQGERIITTCVYVDGLCAVEEERRGKGTVGISTSCFYAVTLLL